MTEQEKNIQIVKDMFSYDGAVVFISCTSLDVQRQVFTVSFTRVR
jgi:hypothetical protein